MGNICRHCAECNQYPLPAFVQKALGMFGDLVVPLMIFSIGLALTLPKVKHAYTIIPAVVIKLAMVPFISFITAYFLGLKGNALTSCLIGRSHAYNGVILFDCCKI